MSRVMVDCRSTPSEINCSLTIAGEPEEVLDAALSHMADKHGHPATPELREAVRRELQLAEPAMA